MKQRSKYLIIALCIFFMEVLIAVCCKNAGVVRGSVGDFLVVILMFYFIKIFRDISSLKLSIIVFIIALSMEIGQYFNLAQWLGFRSGSVVYIVLGNTFSITDILMYLLGCITVYFIDRKKRTQDIE